MAKVSHRATGQRCLHSGGAALSLTVSHPYYFLYKERYPAAWQVHLMCKFLDKQGPYSSIMEVPDPYYGGEKGFELVRKPCQLHVPDNALP